MCVRCDVGIDRRVDQVLTCPVLYVLRIVFRFLPLLLVLNTLLGSLALPGTLMIPGTYQYPPFMASNIENQGDTVRRTIRRTADFRLQITYCRLRVTWSVTRCFVHLHSKQNAEDARYTYYRNLYFYSRLQLPCDMIRSGTSPDKSAVYGGTSYAYDSRLVVRSRLDRK